MKSIKLLSLCLFLISGFSYGELGVYMSISETLTEEQSLYSRTPIMKSLFISMNTRKKE